MAALYDRLLCAPRVGALFGAEEQARAMLEVERALAAATAAAGLIPEPAARVIARAADVRRLDVPALAAATVEAGNPAIPLVRALTEAVAREDSDAARWVHWGATSQDVIDTASVLQLKGAVALIGESLDETTAVLRDWARRHRDLPMAGRTLLQHALPTSFGLKAAGWLAPLLRGRSRLRQLAEGLPVQLGGAVGTRAAFEGRGADVARSVAAELGLAESRPWHTDRTPVVEVGAALGMLAGNLGRLAGDLLLMSQTEVAELRESAPGGGSSTLPHKRNPVALVAAAAAARRMPGLVASLFACLAQEHERAAGAWHAEWVALRELCECAGAAAEQSAVALSRIEVDPERLRTALELTRGRVMGEAVAMRLARTLGRDEAQRRVREASLRAERDGTSLREALAANPTIAAAGLDLDALLDPATCLGDAGELVDEVLAEGGEA